MSSKQNHTDVILIGAGIMSATLGTLLKELAPDWKIAVFERLENPGEESSHEMNNAGTGHAALCELNYTNEKPDGSIDISKAIKVNQQFQLSLQFWSYLVKQNIIRDPKDFIRPLPHISFVRGEDDIAFLKKRYEVMKEIPLFSDMEYAEDHEKLREWMPLMMEGRNPNERIAATRTNRGTDVNFGKLTRMLFRHLEEKGVEVKYHHHVENLKRTKDGLWQVDVHDLDACKMRYYTAKFVFIGAGGGSLELLQKSGIPESKHIGGFPVSGLFMVCNNQEVVEKHHAKVYGKAKVGAPPMSVPHLDTRYINNKKSLLFGPFAGFSPKFLKNGSNMDLIASVKTHNITTLLAAGIKEMALTKYLIQQLLLTKEQRMDELREFIPDAKSEDWDMIVAGQRVQVIKDTETGGKGTIQFGTEVITSSDGSIAALLGASPGASTCVHVMLEVITKCFADKMDEWQAKIKEMIPSFGISLLENLDILKEIQETTAEILQLNEANDEKAIEREKELVYN